MEACKPPGFACRPGFLNGSVAQIRQVKKEEGHFEATETAGESFHIPLLLLLLLLLLLSISRGGLDNKSKKKKRTRRARAYSSTMPSSKDMPRQNSGSRPRASSINNPFVVESLANVGGGAFEVLIIDLIQQQRVAEKLQIPSTSLQIPE